MSDILKKIHTRGYWEIVIRPSRFDEERVKNVLDLQRIVERSSVHIRGWDYPHIDIKTLPEVHEDWVGQEFEWEEFLEIWRIYQSGQFFHTLAMTEDWEHKSSWTFGRHWAPGEVLALRNAVFTFTEIYEFASRLAMTPAGDFTMFLEIKLCGLANRTLVNDGKGFPLLPPPVTQAEWFTWKQQLSSPDLMAAAWDLALEPAADLFRRFGKEFSIPVLRGVQEQLRHFAR